MVPLRVRGRLESYPPPKSCRQSRSRGGSYHGMGWGRFSQSTVGWWCISARLLAASCVASASRKGPLTWYLHSRANGSPPPVHQEWLVLLGSLKQERQLKPDVLEFASFNNSHAFIVLLKVKCDPRPSGCGMEHLEQAAGQHGIFWTEGLGCSIRPTSLSYAYSHPLGEMDTLPGVGWCSNRNASRNKLRSFALQDVPWSFRGPDWLSGNFHRRFKEVTRAINT